jgi:long-chain fatty acid transport protein
MLHRINYRSEKYMKKILTLTALGTILVASNAMAAGFHLREQSAAAQGNAFAGATAGAENISYTYFNAAGLTRHNGTQLNLGGTYIAPKAQASNVYAADGTRGSDINNIVHAAVAPNMTVSHQLNDKTFLGFALNVPYGMITKYDQDWAGKDHGVTSKVTAISGTPMAAYKATDKLSLGAGLQMQYIKAHLTSAASQVGVDRVGLNGDTFDIGYQLSTLYEFNQDTRAGLSYRSKIKHKLKGDASSSASKLSAMSPAQGAMVNAVLNQDIHARLTTPAMLSMGLYHQLNEKWAVMAEYQRVFWSSFENLDVYGDTVLNPLTDDGAISKTKEKWRDTNFYAVGASYQIDSQWKWRLGLAYDQSAVRLQHRTPRIPDSDRIWYSTGLNYQYNERLSFDLAYTYIYAHKAHLDTSLTGNTGNHVTADYSNSVQLFGLSLNYKF